MSDYIYHIGNDYDCINKEYVILSTDKGQQITVALAASGVPFKGRYDNETIFFDYDRNYKESVDEIIAKFTSDDYAVQRNEIAELPLFPACRRKAPAYDRGYAPPQTS